MGAQKKINLKHANSGLNKKEYFLTNDNLVYSEMCAHEDDLKFLNYDMQSDQFSKNIFHYKNN